MVKLRHYLFVIPAIFTAGLVCIMFHDDKVPDSISDSEKIYVLGVWSQASGQMDEVIKKFEQFTREPEQEMEACVELADAIDQWRDTMEVMRNEAVFFVPFPEASSAGLSLHSKIEGRFASVTDDFVEEVSKRKKKQHNRAAYDKVKSALRQQERVSSTAPCIARECVWCRSRAFLVSRLIDRMGLRE